MTPPLLLRPDLLKPPSPSTFPAVMLPVMFPRFLQKVKDCEVLLDWRGRHLLVISTIPASCPVIISTISSHSRESPGAHFIKQVYMVTQSQQDPGEEHEVKIKQKSLHFVSTTDFNCGRAVSQLCQQAGLQAGLVVIITNQHRPTLTAPHYTDWTVQESSVSNLN